MTEDDKSSLDTKQCPAKSRPDLICFLGRLWQYQSDGPLMFWATCTKCVKVTGGVP